MSSGGADPRALFDVTGVMRTEEVPLAGGFYLTVRESGRNSVSEQGYAPAPMTASVMRRTWASAPVLQGVSLETVGSTSHRPRN